MVEKIEEQTYLEIKSEQQRIRKSIYHIYICTSPYLSIYHVKKLFSPILNIKKNKPLTKEKAHTIRNPHKTKQVKQKKLKIFQSSSQRFQALVKKLTKSQRSKFVGPSYEA